MRRISRSITALLLALTMVFALAACGKPAVKPEPPVDEPPAPVTPTPEPASPAEPEPEMPAPIEPVLRICTLDEAEITAAPFPWTYPGGIAGAAMFRTLIRADASLEPSYGDLAEAWSTEDGLTYAFLIKSGQRWSDGEPVTAEDVKFSLEAVLRSPMANAVFIRAFGTISGAKKLIAGETEELSGVTVTENGVTVRLAEKNSLFLKAIAQLVILPKHALESADPAELHRSVFWEYPVTSGPFRIGERSPGNRYTLVPNEYYSGEPWRIEKIVCYLAPDILAAAETGSALIIPVDSAADASELSSLSFMACHPAEGLRYGYLVCNMSGADGNKNKAMSDIKVREAIALAIDRAALIDEYLPGLARPMGEYDPARAKELLTEAGYDFTYTLRILCFGDRSEDELMEGVAKQLGAVGVAAEVSHTTHGSTELFNTRQYDIGFKTLDAFDEVDWYEEYSSSHNSFIKIFGKKSGFDDMLSSLRRASDAESRQKVLVELAKHERESMLKLPLFIYGGAAFVNEDCLRLPDGLAFGDMRYLYDLKMNEWEIIG